MRAISLVPVLAVLTAAGAFAQIPPKDLALEFSQGGVPATGQDVVYALVVTANLWTTEFNPFEVRLTVPPELEPPQRCNDGEPNSFLTFDPKTRLLTWSSSLDNPYIALKTCPLVFRVPSSVAPGSTFQLDAAMTTPNDPNPGNNRATIGGVVRSTADIGIEVSADLRNFRPGTAFKYTFTITNHGPLDANDVTLLDRVSENVEFVSFRQTGGPPANVDVSPTVIEVRIPMLPNAATATFELTVRAKREPEAYNIFNRAVVSSGSSDPVYPNNERDLVTFAGPRADLGVTSVRQLESSILRTPVAVRVTNDGPDAVNNVTVVNSLGYGLANAKFVSATPSQGTCSAPVVRQVYVDHYPTPYWALDCALGALAPGASATIVVVVEQTGPSDAIRLSSAVGPAQNDPNQGNNQSLLTFKTSPTRRRGVRK